jgi:hypothetical protein
MAVDPTPILGGVIMIARYAGYSRRQDLTGVGE